MAFRTTGVRYDLVARDSASKTFNSVGSSASKLEKGLGRLAKAGLMAGTALAAGVAVGLVDGTKKAVAFEAEMKKIQTQAGATAGDVKVLSAQVLELGKSTQQGPEKLAESLYHLKSVGMSNVEAMTALKTASDLAAVGGSDLEATTNALAGAWRTGIRGAESFTKTASTVNAVIGAGNMRMEDMVAALGTGILPTAKTFGLTFAQVGGALALFTDEGIDSASAATRLRMSISLLAAPSGAAEKQLRKIGLTGNMLGQAMRSPDGIIGAIKLLSLHLDKSGLDATHQAALLSRAFGGGKSSSAILSMVNNLDVLEKKQEQINNSMGKYGPAVEAQRKTAAAQFALIKSNFEVFEVKAGNLLLPPITQFTTYINKTALPAVHHYSQELLGMVPVDKIKAGFTAATGLVGDFIGGLMPKSKKATVTAPAIQVKAPTVPDALRRPFVFTTPAPQLKSAKASIPRMLQVPKAQDSAAKKFGLQLRGLVSGGIGDAIKGIDWGQLGKTIGSGLATAVGWVGEHTADLTKRFIKFLGKIDYVQIGKSFGKMAIPLAIGIIGSLFDPLFSLDFWQHHWLDTIIAVLSIIPMGKIAGPLAKVFSKVPVLRFFSPLLRGIEAMGKPIGDAAGGVVKFFGSSLWKGIARVFPEATSVLERESGLLTTRLGSWAIDLSRAGGRAIRFLGNGIKDGFGWVIAKVGEGIGYIIKPFADAGSWLIRKGGDVVTGLGRGIAAGASAIGRFTVDHVVTPVRGAFSRAGSWLVGRGSAVVSGVKSGITTGASKLGSWMKTNVIDKITGAFTKPATWLAATGGAIVSGLVAGTWSWLSKKGNDFVSWAGKIKDKIVSAITSVFKIASPSKLMMTYGGHIIAGLQHGMLRGKDVLHAAVRGLFHSPLEAAENLLKNGVKLPAKWVGKLLSAKAPQGSDVPLNPNVASAQSYAAGLVGQLWPKDAAQQMGALRSLWMAESGWKANARNAASGAYGIPQALPPEKMASAGGDWRTSAATQIRWGLSYIKSRYGDPATAWGSWNVHRPHWYAAGGLAPIGQTAWVGERGPELMQVTPRGTRILSNRDSLAMARMSGMQVPGYSQGTVAGNKVAAAEAELAMWKRREARAHSKARRHADALEVQAAEKRLAAAKKLLTGTNSVANSLQNGFLKSLETGTAAGIAAAVKGMNTRLQAAGAGSLVAGNLRTSAQLQSLATRKASIASRIAQAKQFASDQAGSLGDFLSVGGTSATSAAGVVAEMRKGQRTASAFAAEVAGLSKRGLSKTLLSQLAAAGPGSQLAAALSHASAADIKSLNAAAGAQDQLTTSFGRTMADSMYDSGKDAAKGFLTGLASQEKALQAQMNRLADGMVNTIKKRLGVHSPSTVFRDEVGKQIALGTATGIDLHGHQAARAVQRMADTAAAVRARARATGQSAGGDGGQVAALKALAAALASAGGTEVHVHVNDPALRDLIRIEVEGGHAELAEALGVV
ncbi:phage tail tape measure protein [Streptomyces cocklensis]|uniref:Phage tail tape measure protein domain-containing protein n=1 Tax=Actinacidiphila cocklensis TaxID=887465 RepID=A0A9W4E3U6_9ACTN|nr:phage tail tape measure protein [Actinacidiphila cocklensis]MDD1057915.1 phage tail tape measure protein [Actinacidiphila cocklensis]CAG6392780.1 conserved hypothetical protein [Actinacidiphila cocklensis]